MAYITLVAGLILLALSGDALVRGAVSAAERLHVPSIIVGLTIVAMGTSAPELVVSLEAALRGAPGLAIGNALGSNISNILLVLGVPAIIVPILFIQSGIRRSTGFMIGAALVLYALAFDGTLTRLDGLVLLALLAVYLVYSGYIARRSRRETLEADFLDTETDAVFTTQQILMLIVFGIVGLALGGKMTTEGAMGVARELGVASGAVGLTVVALGTSLPELAATVAAAIRRHESLAIGNVVGSNVFNMLGILGFTSVVTPLAVPPEMLRFDFWIMIGTAVLLVPFVFGTRRIGRAMGIVMTLGYIAYVYVTFAGIA